MAWDTGTSGRLISADNAIAGIDSDTLTIAFKINVDDVAAGGDLFAQFGTAIGGDGRISLIAQISGSVFGFKLRITYSGDNGTWQKSTSNTEDTFHDAVWTYDKDSLPARLWVNGVEATVNTVLSPTGSRTTGADTVSFGQNLGGGAQFDGGLAEFAVWDRVLTVAEIEGGLLRPYSPLFYPRNLQVYWDLVRGFNDRIQGVALTESGTGPAIVPHPRIMYPASPFIMGVPAAAPGGLSIPVAMDYYRRRRMA